CKRRGFAPKKDIPSIPSTDGNERTRVLPAIGQTDVNVRFRKLREVDISATAPSKGGHSEAVKEISEDRHFTTRVGVTLVTMGIPNVGSFLLTKAACGQFHGSGRSNGSRAVDREEKVGVGRSRAT
ncbi:MAG: hypothetical protein O3C60_15090, partial [Planctomycetota bacterium]|nr:hypothetical protein [Planctomycetota bacterium]